MLAAIANTFITRNPTTRTNPVPYPCRMNSSEATGTAVIAIDSSARAPHANASPNETT